MGRLVMETRTLPDLRERALRSLRQRIRRQTRPPEKRHILTSRLPRLLAPLPPSHLRRHLPHRLCPQHLCHRPHFTLPWPDAAERVQKDACGSGRHPCEADAQLPRGARLVVFPFVLCVLQFGDCGG